MSRDAEFIRERNWPHWPLLPVVHRTDKYKVGVVATVGNKFYIYPDMNLYDFDAQAVSLEIVDIDKFLVEWRID